ncbi:PH (Pleckstrin Homology) domain-containing protein [Blastococcus colisei]|uniref:PH (Pleckstrin Homology) domain-containing protein n=1 Tax=Blastococcus colisei TaxID=1564162 RepID=A0A543P9F9_9ACTN|nr:PH domain-containing protein [Blastococcus colisei]TQN40702.1 PH (Pleckstrin Homology) domain-containing protein [Blastococcus colisei]
MTWTPPTWDTAATASLGVLLAVGVPVVADAPGRILAAAGAILLLGLALRDVVLRPRLSASHDGVVVRTLTGAIRLPWADVRVRVRETRRFGLRGRTLELDTAAGPHEDGSLIVLGRRDLGADPETVARTLWELDPRPR